MSSRLIALPRELRDQIIELVVTSHHFPPKSNHDSDRRSRQEIQSKAYRSWLGLERLLFENEELVPAAAGLLRTSRQIRDETTAALSTMSRNDRGHVLDLMFVEEKELWPTWEYVPVGAKDIEVLHANVRIVGAMKGLGAGYSRDQTIWNIGNGAPPTVVWPFYALLEHILTFGTRLPKSGDDEVGSKRGFLVRNLIINVTTTATELELAKADEQREWFQARDRFRRNADSETLQSKIMRPEWLAEYLRDFFQYLLSMSYDMGEYGGFLYKWLGTVIFKADDTIIKHIDLGERLSILEYNDSFGNMPRDQREGYFDEWKTKTIAWRTNHGMSLGPTEMTEGMNSSNMS